MRSVISVPACSVSGEKNSDNDIDIGPIIAIIGICLAVFILVLVVFFVIRRRNHYDERELSEEQGLNPEAPVDNPNVESST